MSQATDKELLRKAFFGFLSEITHINPTISLFDITEVLGELQSDIMKRSVEKAAQEAQLDSRG